MEKWILDIYNEISDEEKIVNSGNKLMDIFSNAFERQEKDNKKIIEEAELKVKSNREKFINYAKEIKMCSTFKISDIGKAIADLVSVYYCIDVGYSVDRSRGHVIYYRNGRYYPRELGPGNTKTYTFYKVFGVYEDGKIELGDNPFFREYPILIEFINLLVDYRMKKNLYSAEKFTEVELRLVLKEFILKHKDEIETRQQEVYNEEEKTLRAEMEDRQQKRTKLLEKLYNNPYENKR